MAVLLCKSHDSPRSEEDGTRALGVEGLETRTVKDLLDELLGLRRGGELLDRSADLGGVMRDAGPCIDLASTLLSPPTDLQVPHP